MKCNIEFRKKDNKLFLLFWKRFEKKIEFLKNVTIENTDEIISLTYETTSKLSNKVIKLWLADAIVLFYKEEYLLGSLKGLRDVGPINLNILAKALSIFDKASDVDYVINRIDSLVRFNVYSFYVFKLGELRLLWQDVANLIVKSFPLVVDSNALIELLKYLLIMSETNSLEVSVEAVGEYLYITDSTKNNLVEPILLDSACGIKTILELIALSPQIINISINSKLKPDVLKLINDLFESKVVYCT